MVEAFGAPEGAVAGYRFLLKVPVSISVTVPEGRSVQKG